MVTLTTPVGNLNMVGPIYSSKLQKLGILTVEDLLYHIPNRYENYSLVSKINSLQEGESVTVFAKIDKFINIYSKSGKKIQKVQVSDETGIIDIIFFNSPFLKNILKTGSKIALTGTVKNYLNKLSFIAPGYELIKENNPLLHSSRLVPIYPETQGITSKWLRSRIGTLFKKLNIEVPEILPESILKKYNLLALNKALNTLHFPESQNSIQKAKDRLSFDELLIAQLSSIIRKKTSESIKNFYILKIKKNLKALKMFTDSLPFVLTFSQKKALTEILNDFTKKKPMNRLLQGDVGSGKTIVALIAAYISYLNGYKCLFMAPTEILAKQHYMTFKSYLESFGLKIKLITSETTKTSLTNSYDILIGTHALLFQKIGKSNQIGLIIIDEQQRFGVEQRASLRRKSKYFPHLLSLTATPIPRTIALTLYSDLDMSIIDELPKGRLIVKTFAVPPQKRISAYNWIKKEIISSNFQKKVFIICPLIEESETLSSVKSAKKEFEHLKTEIFQNFNLGLIHGKLKSADKQSLINQFKNGKINILVATPIVEVGIDIPQASIILIEAADRFGLSQLHQLRGRVGRGVDQSYCLLFTDSTNVNVLNRLRILEKYNLGIKIAEKDLHNRGPGDLWGKRQHGEFSLRFTDFSDLYKIKTTKEAAHLIYQNYDLKSLPLLRQKLEQVKISNRSGD